MDGYGGQVGGNARFDLTNPREPHFAVKAKVDTVNADALLSAWTPAKGLLAGALSTDIDLSGAAGTPEQLKRTLTAVGLAAIANGTLGPGPVFEAIGGVTKIPAAISHLVIGVAILVALAGSPFRLSGTLLILLIGYLVSYIPQASIAAEPVSPEVAPTMVTRSPRRLRIRSNSRPRICRAKSLNASVGP